MSRGIDSQRSAAYYGYSAFCELIRNSMRGPYAVHRRFSGADYADRKSVVDIRQSAPDIDYRGRIVNVIKAFGIIGTVDRQNLKTMLVAL